MSQIVEVRNLSKTFLTKDGQVDALRDINLSVEKGDIYGIIGMSGAGKSTLVRCLNYLEVPTEGQVLVEGQELGQLSDKELRALRSSIGMIFQSFNLLMQKSVLDNICFPLQIQGVKKKDAIVKARELLNTVGLADKEKAYPAQLSGGQRPVRWIPRRRLRSWRSCERSTQRPASRSLSSRTRCLLCGRSATMSRLLKKDSSWRTVLWKRSSPIPSHAPQGS